MNSNFLVIFFFALNGIIEQLALYVKNVGSCIKDSNYSFHDMWMGVLCSIIAFILMFWLINSMSGVTLVIYLTYYFIFFRTYSWAKNYDVMVINMNLQMPDEKREEENLDEDSSFHRIVNNGNE